VFSATVDACTAQLATGLLGQHRGACATTPRGRAGAMLEGGWIDQAMEGLCQRARDGGRWPGARSIQQALEPLRRKALPPFSEGGMGPGEGRGDGADMVACHDRTAGRRPAKDASLLGLLQDGLSGRQRMLGKVACEGAHGFAPWERRTFVSHMPFGA
jgi:hypothetical protein